MKCELSFKNVRISSDFSILFLRSAVKRPQTEKIRSTYAWLAGAATKSSARGYFHSRMLLSRRRRHTTVNDQLLLISDATVNIREYKYPKTEIFGQYIPGQWAYFYSFKHNHFYSVLVLVLEIISVLVLVLVNWDQSLQF